MKIEIVSSGVGTYRDICFVDGKYVAVGDGGLVSHSVDGKVWTDHNSGIIKNLYGISYGDGLWVVVGQDGVIYESRDAVSWMLVMVPNDVSYKCVAYIGGKFYAGGIGNPNTGRARLTIRDGGVWHEVDSGTGSEINQICSHGGNVFLCGSSGNVGRMVGSGYVWNRLGTRNLHSIASNGVDLLTGGGSSGVPCLYISSNNGQSWREVSVVDDAYYMGIVWIGDRWVACGNGDVINQANGKKGSFFSWSCDGIKWNREVVPNSQTSTLLGIATNGNDVVCGGARKLIVFSAGDGVVPPPPPPPPSERMAYRVNIPFATAQENFNVPAGTTSEKLADQNGLVRYKMVFPSGEWQIVRLPAGSVMFEIV